MALPMSTTFTPWVNDTPTTRASMPPNRMILLGTSAKPWYTLATSPSRISWEAPGSLISNSSS